jgi:hypothetical protein
MGLVTIRGALLAAAVFCPACFTKPAPPSGSGPPGDASVDDSPVSGSSPIHVADNHGNNTNASSLNLALRIPEGDSQFLLAALHLGGNCANAAPNVLSVTVTGNVAMMLLRSIEGTPCGPGSRAEHYGLVAPPTGDIDIVFQLDAAAPSFHVFAVALDHVNQDTPTRVPATNMGASVSSLLEVDSSPNELVIDTISQGNGITQPGAQQERLYTMNQSPNTTGDNSGASVRAGNTTVTMTWDFVAMDQWQAMATSIKPP